MPSILSCHVSTTCGWEVWYYTQILEAVSSPLREVGSRKEKQKKKMIYFDWSCTYRHLHALISKFHHEIFYLQNGGIYWIVSVHGPDAVEKTVSVSPHPIVIFETRVPARFDIFRGCLGFEMPPKTLRNEGPTQPCALPESSDI